MEKVETKIHTVKSHLISSRIEVVAAITSLAIFAFITIGIIYYPPLLNFDLHVDLYLKKIQTPGLTSFMILITDLGTWGNGIVAVAGASAFLFYHRWRLLINWLGTYGGATVLSEMIKLIIARPRPPIPHLVHVFTFSFPSGHALISLVGYGIAAYHLQYMTSKVRYKIIIAIIWGILVLSIGFSRLYLSVHYFSDVIAGYSIGISWLIVCIRWAEKEQEP
jgi:membrane-associated phospholipid phosphatase